jgi:S1-C subfamily serine protease
MPGPVRPPGFRPPPNPFAPNNPNRPQVGGPVIAEAKVSVKVMFNRGTNEEQFIDAEVVAWDEDADLAALRIKGARNLPPALELADETTLNETMPVNIFGFPGGVKDIYIGTGKVSQLRRDATTNELVDVQINGQINPGNSGGPVVDNAGRLVGIAVSYVPGKNLGFAIPTVHLTHMLRGSIRAGVIGSLRQQGNAMIAHADV